MRRGAAPVSSGAAPSALTILPLLLHHEVAAAVLLPARFIVLGAERMFLAPAHCFDAVARDSERDHVILHGIRAPLAQAKVVFRRAALVAMALHRHVDLRIGAQEFRVL